MSPARPIAPIDEPRTAAFVAVEDEDAVDEVDAVVLVVAPLEADPEVDECVVEPEEVLEPEADVDPDEDVLQLKIDELLR